MDYFWQHGYGATSMDDLVHYLGISRSSLYTTWEGKAGLFRTVFERYLDTIGMQALHPLKTVEDPADVAPALHRVFTIVATQVSRDPLRRGCMMVNTITELSRVEPELAEIAREAQEAVRSMFRGALEPLVRAGSRTPDRADADAAFLLTLFMGLRVLARSGPAEAEARAIAERGVASILD